MIKFINKYTILAIITILSLSISLLYKNDRFSNIEDIDFVAGVGFDINYKNGFKNFYVPVAIYHYNEEGKTTNYILESSGRTTVDARINRQLHTGKRFSLGSEKVYIFSQNMSKEGILPAIDGLLNNHQITNTAKIVTTSNNPKDILELKISGYQTSSDYIRGLLTSLQTYSFLSDEYNLFNAYIQNTSEGQKFIAPNIDMVNNTLELTSLSVFDKGKQITSIPIKFLRNLSLLRNKSGEGLISYFEDDKNFLTFETRFKKKVKCTKNKYNTFNFKITLNIDGKISNNNYYEKLILTPNEKYALEKKVEEFLERELLEFLWDMKTSYKADLLNLGNIAVANYGRHKFKNLEESILKSNIDLEVNFKIRKFGIGNII